MKYIDRTSLSNYIWKIKQTLGTDPILKWEKVKKCRKFKAGYKYCDLCMEKKFAEASYNNPNELLHL